eukprot:m.70887 g.70887  ORF g.70887 m.70887 type:complete len:620 (+) comp14328_c0_seq1:62-1921(+)
MATALRRVVVQAALRRPFASSACAMHAGCNSEHKPTQATATEGAAAATAAAKAENEPSRSTASKLHQPSLADFIRAGAEKKGAAPVDTSPVPIPPYLQRNDFDGHGRSVYFEVYGCQMNTSDAEVAWSVLRSAGFERTDNIDKADVILAVTCAIRDNAERKVWQRLDLFRNMKRAARREGRSLQIGVLGCMAERLKGELLEAKKLVDLVAGPDTYRDLPRMLAQAAEGNAQVNVMLSMDETYADVAPLRLDATSKSAFVSIQRGCDNMCSFCIVPFTRGRERSRPMSSILSEIRQLSDMGVKDVTLLGQNVNSYRDLTDYTIPLKEAPPVRNSDGFQTIYKSKRGGLHFADLLDEVAQIDKDMRIRFTSPHPKDFPDEVLQVIGSHVNICKQVHLPAQSGSTAMLQRMRRGHTREAYLKLAEKIRSTLPDVTLSSDFISGFCGETEEDHLDSMDLVRQVKYENAFLFAYSMRERTHAHRNLQDDVPQEVKGRRLKELIDCFHENAAISNKRFVGRDLLVMIDCAVSPLARVRTEGFGPHSRALRGRSDGNLRVFLPEQELPDPRTGKLVVPQPGDYVVVRIMEATSGSLRGRGVQLSSISAFHSSTDAAAMPLPAERVA